LDAFTKKKTTRYHECYGDGNHQIDVYVDGSVRRGTDILKAVALGAKAVLIGRPVI